jgi:hypothetical protein
MSNTFEIELKKCLTGSKCLKVRVEADSAEEAEDKARVNEMEGQSIEADRDVHEEVDSVRAVGDPEEVKDAAKEAA